MPDRSDHQSAVLDAHQEFGLLSTLSLLIIFFVGALLPPLPALAELRVVTAQGEYRMGGRDTKEDAVRLATESAKRQALEQVATYLESITVVDGMDITRDEIRTYTAGLVLVLDQRSHTSLDGETVVVTVDLVAQIDTEEVEHAIMALRENEDARAQLTALKQENEQLQQDLDAANRALVSASTQDQVESVAQQRQDILNRVQSNSMVSQAWTEWVLVGPVVYSYPWLGQAQTRALLNQARGLYPASPHVAVAEQVLASGQPPVPARPPTGSTVGGRPSRMPRYERVTPPGSSVRPRALNEITHSTPFVHPNGTGFGAPGENVRPLPHGMSPREVPGGAAPRFRGQSPGAHQFNSGMPGGAHPSPHVGPRSFGGGGHGVGEGGGSGRSRK